MSQISNKTQDGNKIERNFVSDRNLWEGDHSFPCERVYDNGYTAAHGYPETNTILTYCEGDVCVITCESKESYEAEKASHLKFFEENNK